MIKNPEPAQPAETPVVTTEVTMDNAVAPNAVEMAPRRSPLNPKMLLGVLIVLLVGGAAYAGMNFINTPARVKEQVMPTHLIFSDYEKSVTKVAEELAAEDDSETADAMERSLKKAEDLVATAKSDQAKLKDMLNNLTISQARNYKMAVEEYDRIASQIIDLEQASIDTFGGYIDVLKEYQDLEVETAGISQLLYSDPNKYVTELEGIITKLEGLRGRIEDIEAKAPFVEFHKNFIATMTDEITLLQDMKTAVEDRSTEDIGVAAQKYAEASQKTQNEGERLSDKIDDEVENLSDDAEAAAEKVELEYTNLQSEYKF